MKLVLVEWEDSRQPNPRWQHRHDVKVEKPVYCYTAGWLINEGHDKYVKLIAQNICDDAAQVGGVMEIPARSIKSIKRLTPPTRRAK